MINGVLIEAVGWLGYLQRGEVNLQIIPMVSLLLLENQIASAAWVQTSVSAESSHQALPF